MITWSDTVRTVYGMSYLPIRYAGEPAGADGYSVTIEPAGPLAREFPVTSPPAVGDLDGNGSDEVVFTLPDSRLVVVNRSLGGAGESLRVVGLRSHGPSAPALGDVDGDGTLEIALWDDGFFYVYEHNARLRTNWPQPLRETQLGDFPPLSFERATSSPLLADIDGNGRVEILVPTAEGTLYEFDGDGTRNTGFTHPIPDGSGATPTLADLDGDGSLRLVTLGSVSSIGTIDAVSDTIVPMDEMALSIQSFPGSNASGERFWPSYQHDNLRTGRVSRLAEPKAPGSIIEAGSFKIYPNPVHGGGVHTRVVLNRTATVNIEIYNLEG
ncbi:MAG: VCBS repeat-containing protein, partial [bacterium]